MWFLVAAGVPYVRAGVTSSLLDNSHEWTKVYALVAPEPPSNAVLGGTRGLVDGTHWKQPSWSGRAFLSLLSDPPALLLNRLERSDSGNYVCNVTYRSDNFTSGGVTVTTARVQLFVAVPLQPPVITDHQGTILNSTAGPYAEGDIVRLTCRVPPVDHKLTLSWWRNEEPLRSTFGTVPTSDGGWENTVELGPLHREHLFANVTCSSTSDISVPVASSVLLDLFLPPTEVSIWSWPYDKQEASGWLMLAAPTRSTGRVAAELSTQEANDKSRDSHAAAWSAADESQQAISTSFYTPRSFECEVTGSRPQPNVTWFLDGRPLDDRLSYTHVEGNATTSVLLLPFLEHAGKLLECRATNVNMPDSRGVLSGVLWVNISNKPEVNVRLGAGLNASYITEGADVYMECSVLAASSVADVTWSHDGRELVAQPEEGVVLTTHYLVIRRVGPGHTGSYTCRVTSSEGEFVESTPLFLSVRYSPRCGSDGDQTLHVEKDEAVNVTCDVRADPSEPLRYFWLLEDDTEVARETNKERGKPSLQKSPQITYSERLAIVANASIFNVVLACWAENAVGTQRKRCRFKFSPKRQDSSLVCSVGNYTDTSFSLTCSAVVVSDTTSRQLRVDVFDATQSNRSERSFWSREMGPIFVTRLHPATDYLVTVRMHSQATFLTYVRTLSPAQTLVGQGDFQKSTQRRRWTLTLSIIMLTSGFAFTFVALLTGYLVCVLKRRRRKPRRPPDDVQSASSESANLERVHICDHKKHLAAADSC
ncbi:hemicentin-1-like isoform X2 [Dermacentor albipictus]|uniref:hemicentin-1-like isoform X2 n=1 Tax=Dermacentor albipictus TaxID=60249 RepID=UPI0038FCEDD6